MQSVSTEVVQLLPPHILLNEPHTICTMVKQAIDTCSIENHELLDAEARTLTYTSEQELSEYAQKHRELRHRIQGVRIPQHRSRKNNCTINGTRPSLPPEYACASYDASLQPPEHHSGIYKPYPPSAADPKISTRTNPTEAAAIQNHKHMGTENTQS